MNHFWWRGACGRNVVDRYDDDCVRCKATVAALLYPITHDPLPLTMRAPLGVRILRFIGRSIA